MQTEDSNLGDARHLAIRPKILRVAVSAAAAAAASHNLWCYNEFSRPRPPPRCCCSCDYTSPDRDSRKWRTHRYPCDGSGTNDRNHSQRRSPKHTPTPLPPPRERQRQQRAIHLHRKKERSARAESAGRYGNTCVVRTRAAAAPHTRAPPRSLSIAPSLPPRGLARLACPLRPRPSVVVVTPRVRSAADCQSLLCVCGCYPCPTKPCARELSRYQGVWLLLLHISCGVVSIDSAVGHISRSLARLHVRCVDRQS